VSLRMCGFKSLPRHHQSFSASGGQLSSCKLIADS